jgi:hypothetical protein
LTSSDTLSTLSRHNLKALSSPSSLTRCRQSLLLSAS